MQSDKVNWFLLLNIVSAMLAARTKTTKENSNRIACDGLIFNHVYYDKKVLVANIGKPYNLALHKFSGVLFFSHTIKTATHVDFGIMACYLEKRNCIEVLGVNGGYAVGYDTGNDDIYFGGHDGLYKYNFLTKAAEYFAEEGKSIWSIFIRRNFYYIEYPTQKLHVYQDDVFVPVAEASKIEIDTFFVSRQRDIYFSNKTALFKVGRPTKRAVVLNDDLVIRQIAEDGYGDVYFCASDGIYIEDKPYNSVKKVANIDQAFGLTFDEHDRLVYSDVFAIYRLVPSKHGNLCYHALREAQKSDDKNTN